MKKRQLVLVALLACTQALTAMGCQMKPAVYIGGGFSMPSRDWSDYWTMGFGVYGRVTFEVAPAIEIGVTFNYTAFPFDDDKFIEWIESNYESVVEGASFEGLDATAIEVLGDFKYRFGANKGGRFLPYMVANFGLTTLTFDNAIITVEGETTTLDMSGISATHLTLGFGAGFEYMLGSKAGFWLEGKYMVILNEGEPTSHIPICAGLKFIFGGN
jgi:hypothetical protein